ncbi:MAG: pyridoxamine 5'-phosphate oxidase [Alphaproteobacteria bacterium]|nr:pyridoxamine 5'-phosphate oxidase [Alphaproteobacteria bacterium]
MTIMPHAAPFARFADWFAAASAAEPNDPNAMALATAGSDGVPSLRVVLLKAWDERGFVFYTNLASQKGREIAANRHVHLNFHWKSLQRQVRIGGTAALVSEAEADAYFATRPRDSQLGAWASLQSQPLPDRAAFEARLAAFDAQFPDIVPRPPHWSGWRVTPARIEYWQARDGRWHEREAFVRDTAGWQHGLVYP